MQEHKKRFPGPRCENGGISERKLMTLRDANGNPVIAEKRYYMESHAFPQQKVATAYWGGGSDAIHRYWAMLKFNSCEPIRFEKSGNHVKMLTDRTLFLDSGIEFPLYLATDEDDPGVKCTSHGGDRTWWIITEPTDPDLVAGNYYAFRNYSSYRFMRAVAPLGWLYVDKTDMDSKTMWRLIPIE
ncbi:hypothetical protein [Bacillus cereus]|uniref:hypothetical protein n=1 Tax=Bacillus cereus TaxID=1396 RepID=UPI000BEC89FB|nr:hypothetical protein [Bacillus cereus]PEA00998.1 hypothetical protein CON37_30430 [Bacillus cereus]